MAKLLSINSYHYRRGGADAVYLDHAELLTQLGWENAFFSMHHPKNLATPWSRYFVDEIQYGHQYSVLEKIGKATKVVYSFEAQRRIAELVADFKPDIAHLHNIYHHLSPSILSTLKKLGLPVVMTAHDLKIACPNNKMLTEKGICEECKGGRYHRAVVNRCVQQSLAASTIIAFESTLHGMLGSYRKHVDRMIVPSRFFIDKLVEWGWPRESFSYVPNFVDSKVFAPAYEPGTYVAYFGRLAVEKGISTLVKAAARARVPLVIVGTGPIEQELKALAQQLNADVHFAGYQTGRNLYRIIEGSRATVLPSEWYENSPIAVLESMALGKPIIGAAIGGIPEMVRESESGWLFQSGNVEDLAEKLSIVEKAPNDAIAKMGRQARRIVESEFSRERYVESVLAIYQDLGVKIPARKTELIPA